MEINFSIIRNQSVLSMLEVTPNKVAGEDDVEKISDNKDVVALSGTSLLPLKNPEKHS